MVVLLMLDLLGTDEGRVVVVGLVGYFRGSIPIVVVVVPRAILDDELPIIYSILPPPFFSFSFS